MPAFKIDIIAALPVDEVQRCIENGWVIPERELRARFKVAARNHQEAGRRAATSPFFPPVRGHVVEVFVDGYVWQHSGRMR